MNIKTKMIINAIERKFKNPATTLSLGIIGALIDAECYHLISIQDDSVNMVECLKGIEQAGIEARAHYKVK